ncbi:MAG: cytochrome d ubiquinol oxidase subunit II [Bacteroidales bacterium]|jgi:cytochrome d ubiquinol oxidase subunit II|nr:cytochrome d ubiquinol oxidase subunit II [Bacteroidales bacterium]
MFESLSQLALQQYWWVIVSLLGSILVFLMFVQGGQTLIYAVGKTEEERSLIVNSLGRKWEFTFTTLVTFGGAFFASFPLFYSTSFGGAYWVWMLILICFVLQAVSYEFRSRPNNFLGQRIYEYFLLFNGIVGTVLVGTAVGTFFNGAVFSVSDMNLSRWETPYHGLEAALNPHNLLLGISVFLLARVLALLYFLNNIDNEQIATRSKIRLLRNAVAFVVCFVTFLVWLLIKDGFNYDPVTVTKTVNLEPYKYLHNLLAMPVVLVMLLAGIVLVLFGIIRSLIGSRFTRGIWYAGFGTVLAVLSLFLVAGFHHTCYYPSIYNIQDSLTIENSSSSHYTLTAMSYVSLFVPFVIAYIAWAWRAMNKKQITTEELNEESHKY